MNFRVSLVLMSIVLPSFALAEGSLEQPPTEEVLEQQKTEAKKAAKTLPQQSFDINHATKLALLNNPRIKQAEQNLEAVRENEDQAIAQFLPQVSANIEYGRQRNALGGADFEYSDVDRKSISVSQALWNGGRNLSRYDTALLQIENAQLQLEEIKQQTILDTVTAYINAASDSQLFELNVKNEALLYEHLETTRDRFELGELSQTDFAQSSTRHTLALNNRINSTNRLKASKDELERLVGISVESDNLDHKINIPKIPDTLEKATEIALAQNPTIQQSKINLMLAKEGIDANLAEAMPSLSLEASMSREEESGLIAQDYDNDYVALRLAIPIFKGGENYSKISQARKLVNAQDFELADNRMKVVRNLKSTWQYAQTAGDSIDLLSSAIQTSEQAIEGTKAEEEIGVRTVLDILNAEQEKINAEINLIVAKKDQLIQHYSLLSICGELDEFN